MGEVLFPHVVRKVTKPQTVTPNFADNTWATIIKACHQNRVPDTWVVGAQKSMTINGTEYLVDIIGKKHDDYADGSGKAPLTFQLHDLYETEYKMDDGGYNGDGWLGCDMRRKYLPQVLALMPTEVQAGIREVTKWTSEGNTSAVIETTADKLFLPSEIEIFGEVSNSFDGEGSQYAYYAAGNSAEKMHIGGDDTDQWFVRSPYNGGITWFCSVSMWGDPAGAGASDTHGIAPAFCF